MRRLVHDSNISFTPLLFILYPEAKRAMAMRDRWIRSTWPLWKQKAIPLSNDALEIERCETEEADRMNSNRLAGGFEALLSGDGEASSTQSSGRIPSYA